MSGLAGVFSLNQIQADVRLVGSMGRILAHRCPSSAGAGLEIESPNSVAMWQGGASQVASSGGLSLVWDGEIYNAKDLCPNLGLTGAPNVASLAMELYRRRGPEGLTEINGDLALALFDHPRNRLLLFRDRFGIRPLYYAKVGAEFIFASEIKALLAHPGLEPEPDQATLFDFLATHYRYIHRDPGRTYYCGVRQVPPAHYLLLTPSREYIRRYWDISLDESVAAASPQENQARLLDLIRDSVSRRLTTQPDMGFSVSSGMDSSSVCSLASVIANQPQDIYSVSYGFSEYDESQGIMPVVEKYGARWRNIVLAEPELLESIQRLVKIHDGPLCTVTWLSHYYMAQAAARDGKIVFFSGLGGDECLAGEYEHFLYFFADLKLSGQETRLTSEIEAWIRLHDHPIFRKSPSVVDDAFARLVDWSRPGRVLPDLKRYQAYLGYFNPDFVRSWDSPVQMANPFKSYLANRCYQDLFYETTPPSLAADEKNMASFGLKSRFPFLDHRVVEFCFSLPSSIKYRQGITKAVMRQAIQGILPEANRTNTVKTGFNAPANSWLMGKEKAQARELLNSVSLRERGWLRPGAAEALFLAHEQGQANHMMVLWQLINAELWLRSLKESACVREAA
jgi:asparagine synthase (glutamine-hydrolysing)